jgi:glucose-1-phosphate thymidylyltransferase
MDNLIGLIPAAGKGVRLGLPYPKELYPIIRNNRYKPVSQFVVDNLVASGVEHIVFVINETKHQLLGYFGDGHRFGCRLSYVLQENHEAESESTSPGLAHALNSAYHLIRGKTVCFGMADTIMTPNNLFRLALDAGQPDDDVIMGLFRTERPEKFGMAGMDKDGLVFQIIDKPAQTDLEYMWGFIIWRPNFTEHLNRYIAEKKVGDFALIMNAAIQAGLQFRGVKIDGTFADLGTYDEISELEKKYKAR